MARQRSAIRLEPSVFRLGSMTVQSSFLIRCSLNAPGDLASRKAYYIQHVQSGAEFRASALADVTGWMADQNSRYLSDAIAAVEGATAAAQDAKEELR